MRAEPMLVLLSLSFTETPLSVNGCSVMALILEDDIDSFRSIFHEPENRFDFVFWNFELQQSDVYHIDGRFLRYQADFHVHLSSPPGPPTSVNVRAINARVATGTTWTIGHAGRMNVYEDVDGTTIEEYSILRAIGDCLGVPEMPQVLLP
jgi:hypothetical protein